MLAKVQNLNENDRAGTPRFRRRGSVLLAAPAAGVSLAEKRAAITAALLKTGASISETGRLRAQTSLGAIKCGGRLAVAAWPVCVPTLGIRMCRA
ncbi:MAG: DUF4147 domain-containing protein [Betaproteobacteria bacterium]|nr:DUF4147 domain-containing protein [Betaproteobacteria bacterium]